MGTIRNRLTIVHDFDLDRITEMRKDAVRYFEKIVEDDSYMEYDVDSQMVSPILKYLLSNFFPIYYTLHFKTKVSDAVNIISHIKALLMQVYQISLYLAIKPAIFLFYFTFSTFYFY